MRIEFLTSAKIYPPSATDPMEEVIFPRIDRNRDLDAQSSWKRYAGYLDAIAHDTICIAGCT